MWAVHAVYRRINTPREVKKMKPPGKETIRMSLWRKTLGYRTGFFKQKMNYHSVSTIAFYGRFLRQDQYKDKKAQKKLEIT